jgi:hypothetical protein
VSDLPTRSHSRRPSEDESGRQLTLDEWANMVEAEHESAEDPQRAESSLDAPPSAAPAEANDGAPAADAGTMADGTTRQRPAATDLLETPEALLTRTDLRTLGLERRAVDAVFRALPVVALPGYSRPLVRVEDYRELVERNTFRDDSVRPGTQAA